MLTREKDDDSPSFKQQRTAVADKVNANTDYFARLYLQDAYCQIVAYMRTRIKGQVYQHISILIKTAKLEQEEIQYKDILDNIEHAFSNLDYKYNTRDKLQKLKIDILDKFNQF